MRVACGRHSHLPTSNFLGNLELETNGVGKMTDNAAFRLARLVNAGNGHRLRLEKMIGYKHRDLILVFSVSLGFAMLFVFSVAG
jgi:hypothetical protein